MWDRTPRTQRYLTIPMAREKYQPYLDPDAVDDLIDRLDADGYADALRIVVEDPELRDVVAVWHHRGNGAIPSDTSRLSDLEERMDSFDGRAQRAFDTRDDRLDSLRVDVEDLRERVESLERYAEQ